MVKNAKTYLFAVVAALLCTPVYSGWNKTVEKDPFDDKKFQLWYQADKRSGVGYFVFGCNNERRISLYWQYADRGRSGLGVMDMGVVVRLDSDSPFEEEWNWNSATATIRPKNAAVFMGKILSKKTIALKTSLGGDVGVFDISGVDRSFQDAKNTCKLD